MDLHLLERKIVFTGYASKRRGYRQALIRLRPFSTLNAFASVGHVFLDCIGRRACVFGFANRTFARNGEASALFEDKTAIQAFGRVRDYGNAVTLGSLHVGQVFEYFLFSDPEHAGDVLSC
jgi:hypothetical protein